MRRTTLFTTLAMVASICASGVVVQAGRPAQGQATVEASIADDHDSTLPTQGPGAALRDIRENERLRSQRLFGQRAVQ
jgi:hypothetical protein